MRKHTSIIKRNHFLTVLLCACCCISGYEIKAQLNYRVLFLGNSYTGVNNLPQMIHDLAMSAGDTLVFESHTPGGYQLTDHYNDAVSQNKIISGGWDYVVIQGQSQEPITFPSQFNGAASALHSMVKQYNPCAVTMPYMTWGRKNGDASNCPFFPVMCTYQGMDTTLRNSYLDLTASITSEVAPVSVVWNYLRQNYPDIELYQPDESHPSLAGSYAAACCFYTSLFKQDPTLITFNSGLGATDAAIIKNAVKTKVYDSLPLWDFKKLPVAAIGYQIGAGSNEVIFNAINQGAQQSYSWNFGDGATASIPYPVHSYFTNGTYTVTLTTSNCDLQGLHTSSVDTIIQFCSHTPGIYTTDPLLCEQDTLWTQNADAYQWFAYGALIPETNQYLSDYTQYGISGFSVMSVLDGCSELSPPFNESAEWSGYYFDALGNPCMGDTVAFAVLHINGFLSGFEKIYWLKNDTLLLSMTNEDTLLITAPGNYECKVVNPNSNCPLDTTSYLLELDCELVGIEEKDQSMLWSVIPNPASEIITIRFSNNSIKEQIQMYNAMGRLVHEMELSVSTSISIEDFPNGLYLIRIKGNRYPPLKFIKQ